MQFRRYDCTVDIDGNAGSQRFKQLLLSPLVVLKVSSPYTYFWSRAVQAWKHYVPVCSDLSNLGDAVQWVHAHPHDASAIAWEATEFARVHLSLAGVYAYMEHLLVLYAQRLDFEPAKMNFTGWWRYRPEVVDGDVEMRGRP